MADALETRLNTLDSVEIRDVDTAPTLDGYASTYNEPYPVGHFDETVSPSAFDRTMKNKPDVRLLVDHEGQPLARTASGTLTLDHTNRKGYRAQAPLDLANPDVQRVASAMKRGDLNQMSFGFRIPAGGDDWDYSGERPLRTLKEINMQGGDVSIVTYPANAGTSASLRSGAEGEASWVLADAMLREVRSGRSFDKTTLRHLHIALDDLGLTLRDTNDAETLDDVRATVSTADQNDLPDSDFAYIEPGGTKDSEGKTVPRSLRHFPIMDKAHVQNALARLSQSPVGDKAKAAVMAAAKKFGIDAESNSGMPLDLALRLAEADALRRSAA